MRTRAEKENEIRELQQRIGRANALILADYRGLSVAQATDLRDRLRKAGEGSIEYRVTKNTLLRIAVDGTPAASLTPLLRGPNAMALSFDEPAVLAKTLVDYAKENDKFEIRGGLLEGEIVDLDQIRALAALPGRDELRAMLMSTLLAPQRNLASALYALLGNLRNALEQRQAQLEG